MSRRALVSTFLLTVLAAAPAAGQGLQLCEQGPAAGDATASAAPIVRLTASAEIRELRFNTAPQVRIYLPGCASNAVRTTERRNLPSPVQPGVTYRDVGLGVEISSYLHVTCTLPPAAQNAGNPAGASALASLRTLCGGTARETAAVPPVQSR